MRGCGDGWGLEGRQIEGGQEGARWVDGWVSGVGAGGGGDRVLARGTTMAARVSRAEHAGASRSRV